MRAIFSLSINLRGRSATRVVAIVILAMVAATTGEAYRRPNVAPEPSRVEIMGPDWYSDSANRFAWLDQGWSAAQSDWFYWTTQGSRLLPYAFFLALEQADNSTLFRDPYNMKRYRFLPQRPSASNPDGLPIGFVADAESALPDSLLTDRRSVGFTCAACHTTNLHYKGTAMRIDGGGAMIDLPRFLIDLSAAIEATLTDDAKFNRFALRVLGKEAKAAKKAGLRSALREVANQRSAYNNVNRSDAVEGFGRLDAFGRIFNNALVLVDPRNGIKADAPARYPHLWDTPRLDFVQWTGVASNTGIGPLMRNLGQMIGVFATIDPGDPPPSVGYKTSIHLPNLRALENQLKSLKSPVWPENILRPIDRSRAAAGRELFVRDCRGCHNDIERNGKGRVLTTQTSVSKLGTDPKVAENLINSRGKTGFLAGTKQDVTFGRILGPTDTAFHITRNTVIHAFFGKLSKRLHRKTMGHMATGDSDPAGPKDRVGIGKHAKYEPQLRYKARPLNGIWANPPYLHNGSVPSLYELLLPASRRNKQFTLGRREFDPVKVGLVTESAEGTFLYDATAQGNSNAGHEYGTQLSETERWQLIEYLKSL